MGLSEDHLIGTWPRDTMRFRLMSPQLVRAAGSEYEEVHEQETVSQLGFELRQRWGKAGAILMGTAN